MRVLGKKWLSTTKKKTLPGSLQTVVRSGEAPQMVPFSKLGNWQIQIFFNEKSMNFMNFVLFSLRIGGIGRKAFSIMDSRQDTYSMVAVSYMLTIASAH